MDWDGQERRVGTEPITDQVARQMIVGDRVLNQERHESLEAWLGNLGKAIGGLRKDMQRINGRAFKIAIWLAGGMVGIILALIAYIWKSHAGMG